jgi:hypothetical protein
MTLPGFTAASGAAELQARMHAVRRFVDTCRMAHDGWRYASTPGGPETLYGSVFACMLAHYLGASLPDGDRRRWAAYLNSWQEPGTGCFVGPEIVPGQVGNRKHSYEHVVHHLTVHVLPTLSLLGARPAHPLAFAHEYLDLDALDGWLAARNLHEPWLEGNNLLFMGQFLIHLRDVEGIAGAGAALDRLFAWLDAHVDPATGLWGTAGRFKPAALFGGYHQLLLYYYESRPVRYAERILDATLSLQHADGGFSPYGGGGACEDVDAIDVLVNLYKLVNYRRSDVRSALRRAVPHILAMQAPDGGFVYRRGEPFAHMKIKRTASGPDCSNLFATWFRVHTLALIGQVLTDDPVAGLNLRFNDVCSMGWHRPGLPADAVPSRRQRWEERRVDALRSARTRLRALGRPVRSLARRVLDE